MTTQDTSNSVLPAQYQQHTIRPSTELGTPSLSFVQVSDSLSLPSGSPLWDQMDQMSLPSSPSPRSKRDLPMDLDRYVDRGFSEDLALPPRQIEKPFRFLDLPAEIRNMVYRLTFEELRPQVIKRCTCQGCRNPVKYLEYVRTINRQWTPPPLGLVSKLIRQETISLYYAVTEFQWYWDPVNFFHASANYSLLDSVEFLESAFDFALRHNVQIRCVTVASPDYCDGPTSCLKEIMDSVRFFASLQQSLKLTGRVHPTLREMKFSDDAPLAGRLFDMAGSLETSELDDDKQLSLEIRLFLHDDDDAKDLIRVIEQFEANERYLEWRRLSAKRRQERDANIAKGPERWNGVLRSRAAQGNK